MIRFFARDDWPCWLWIEREGAAVALDLTTGYLVASVGHDPRGRILTPEEHLAKIHSLPWYEVEFCRKAVQG